MIFQIFFLKKLDFTATFSSKFFQDQDQDLSRLLGLGLGLEIRAIPRLLETLLAGCDFQSRNNG